MDFNLTPILTYDENSEDFNSEDFSEINVHLNIPSQSENNEEQIILLKKGANSIGRDKSCDIVINNQVLSRHHAVIEVDKYSCLIYDVGSRNKTWKGRILLKPNVRYNLENKENIRLANLKAFITIEEAKEECLSLKCEAIKEIPEDEESETRSESLITHEECSPKLTDIVFADDNNANSQHLETVSNNKSINKTNFNDKILINQSVVLNKEKDKSNSDAINYEMLINAPTQRFESYIDSDDDTTNDEKLMNASTQHYHNSSKSDDDEDATNDEKLMNAPTQCYHNNSKSDDDDDVTDDERLMNAPTQHYHNNSKSDDDKDATNDEKLMNAPTLYYHSNLKSDDDDVTDDERLMYAPTQHYHNSPKSDDDVTDDYKLMNAPTQHYNDCPVSDDDVTDDEKLMNAPTEAHKSYNSSSNYMTDDEKLMNAPTQKYDTNISSEENSNDESLLKEVSHIAASSSYISENHSDLASDNNKVTSNYSNMETTKIFQSPNTDENLLSEETQAYLNDFLDNIEEDLVTSKVCNQENNENVDIIQNDIGNIKENNISCPKECIEKAETQTYSSDINDKLIIDKHKNEIINQQNEIVNVETQVYSPDVYNELKNDKEICETINQQNEIDDVEEEKSMCSILNSEKYTSLIDIDINNQKLKNSYTESFSSKTSLISNQQSKFLMEESVADISLNEILCMSTQLHDNEEETQTENLDYKCDYLAETQELQSDKSLISNIENSNADDSEIPPVPDDYVAETPPHLLDLTLSESEDNTSEKSEVLVDLNINENKYFDKKEVISEQISNAGTKNHSNTSENNSLKISKNSFTEKKSKNLNTIEEENGGKEKESDLNESEQIKLNCSRSNSSQIEKNNLLKQEMTIIEENDSFQTEDKKINTIENELTSDKQISTIDSSSSSSKETNNLMKILIEEKSDSTSVKKNDTEKNIQNSSNDLSQKENSLSNTDKMIIEEPEHPSLEELTKCETIETEQRNFQKESNLNKTVDVKDSSSSDDESHSVKNKPVKIKEKNDIDSSKILANLSKEEVTVNENKANSSGKKSCKNNNKSLKNRQKRKLNLSHMEEVNLEKSENQIISKDDDSSVTDNEFSMGKSMKTKKGKKNKSSFQKEKVDLTKTCTVLIEENNDLLKDNEITILNDHCIKEDRDNLIKTKKIKTRQKSKIDSHKKKKNEQQATVIEKEIVVVEKKQVSSIENKNISKCEPMQTIQRRKINLSEKQEENLSNMETTLINEDNVFSRDKNNINNLCDNREKNQPEFEYKKELSVIDSKPYKNKNDSSDFNEKGIIISEKVNKPNIKIQDTDDLQQTHKITDDSPGTKLEICVGKLKELTKTKKFKKQEISNNESTTPNGNRKSLRKQKANISKIIIKNEEELRQSPRKRKLNKCILENENKNIEDVIDYVPTIENKKRKSSRLATAENEVDSSNKDSNIEKARARASNETTEKNDHIITLKQKEKNHNATFSVIPKKDKLKIAEESFIEQDSKLSCGDKSENFIQNDLNEESQFRKNKRNTKKKEHPEYILYPLKRSKRNNSSNNSSLEMSPTDSSMENDELKHEINKTRSKRKLSKDQNKNLEKSPKISDYDSSEKVKQQTENNKKRNNEFLETNKSPKKLRNTPSKTEINENNQIIVSTRKRKQKNEETKQTPIKTEIINDILPKRSKRLSISSSSDSSSLQMNESNLSSSPNKKTSLKNKKQNISKDVSQRLTISPKDKTKKIKIMFTGMNESGDHKIVTKLGGEVVDDPKLCTHLVTDKFHRTVKLLCCVAKGIPVVITKWLHACKNNKNFIDHSEFLLKDSSAEKQYKFDLKNTLSKAEQEPLLKGWSIYATNKVKPIPEQMKDIVQFAGGKYLSRMPTRFADNTVIISCPEDLKTCKHAAKCGIPIVGTEYLLTGLLKYENDINSYRLSI